jgi:hypothetical protein
MTKRKMTTIRLLPATRAQLDALKDAGHGTMTAVIEKAVYLMYLQEIARREKMKEKYQPSDRWDCEERLVELFLGGGVTDDDVREMHVDELTEQISGMIESEEDAPLNHFGDIMTPPDVAEYLKAWADRQTEE